MLKRLWHYRGLWMRILFCWALGSAFIYFDEIKNYDLRFQIRGAQEVSKQIVLVYFDQEDFTRWHGSSSNLIRSQKEFAPTTDSFFWRPQTWNLLLSKILSQSPRSVGVTFFFNSSAQTPSPDESLKSLRDPRVIWAGELDNEGRPVLPLLANSYGYNVALVDFREDEDRVLRRFASPLTPLPHMALKLSESVVGNSLQDLNSLLGETKPINFRGETGLFSSVSATSVLRGRIPQGFFKDKIVIVGTHSVANHQFQTPLGSMTRSEVLAQVIDNILHKRWIARVKPIIGSVYLLAILLLVVVILLTYPQAVASVFLLWLGLGAVALSVCVFDSFYIWVPALSPLVAGLLTYVIFLGYQLARKENQTWLLEQEKKMLSELDQLRNNFVSLISHDLKTPIAKIQAICDRLLASSLADDLRDGLMNVRKESVELHRYIQSILQVSRLEASQVQVRREAIDINELVDKVINQVNTLAAENSQQLTTLLEPMFSIEVDSVMIQEVILNLVENAIKYTPRDGHIQVETHEVDDKVVFSVSDDGPGIPKEDREHIFEKFFRGRAHQDQIKGTGLGLFLVKYFVELHGGEVFLESDVGKGTRVGFTLPLQT